MPGGRPTDYDPKYCDMLIDHMSEGLSFESFGGVVGCCKETLYSWMRENPAFLDARKQGNEASRLLWEKIGIDGTVGKIKNFNAASYIFNKKNRFGWRDQRPEDEDQRKPFVLAYEVKKKKKNE